jgi:O-antigen ligase
MTCIAMFLEKLTTVCLFFLLAAVPLLINPLALDFWYQPKIQSVYALVAILVLASACRHFLCRDPVRIPRTPVHLLLLLYGISAVVSTVLSIHPGLSIRGDAWRWEGACTLLSYAALVFIFSSLVKSRLQAERLVQALLASAFLVALYGLVQYAGFNPTEHYIPGLRGTTINSTMGNGNFLGKFLVLTIPLLLGFSLLKNRTRTYWLCSGALLVALAALVLCLSRASWLGFASSITIFWYMLRRHDTVRSKKKVYFSAAVLAGTLVLLCIVTFGAVRSLNLSTALEIRFRSAFDLQEGTGSATRLFVWQKALPLVLERPWFGYGPDTHEKVYSAFNTEYCRRFKTWVIIDRAHNNYIDMAIAQGLAGVAVYLGVVIWFLVLLRRAIRRESSFGEKALLCSIFSAYCGYLVNDFFSFSVVSVSPTFWSLMGLTISLQRLRDTALESSQNNAIT